MSERTNVVIASVGTLGVAVLAAVLVTVHLAGMAIGRLISSDQGSAP